VGENSEWTAIANNVRGRTKQTFVKVWIGRRFLARCTVCTR
jgi:hypothetical protein